jgi:hypothetical protein
MSEETDAILLEIRDSVKTISIQIKALENSQ